MPKFNKTIEELETRFEKWLFVLKNLHKLDRVPEKLKESIFLQLFETAEISKFSQQEYLEYENSLKYYRDMKNSLDTAKEEGKIEGKIEIAKNMISKGMEISLISEITGLTEKEIKEL
jgi:predicted transposase/invertase (TIGR01784 family)